MKDPATLMYSIRQRGEALASLSRFAAEIAFITSGRSLLDAVKLKSIVVPWGALWLIMSTTTPVSAKISR